MDKYNSSIPKLFQPMPFEGEWAITIGQTVYFTCDSCYVGDAWHRHEDKHKEQWKREGCLKFLVKYFWYNLMYGYQNNPFEVEARLVNYNKL